MRYADDDAVAVGGGGRCVLEENGYRGGVAAQRRRAYCNLAAGVIAERVVHKGDVDKALLRCVRLEVHPALRVGAARASEGAAAHEKTLAADNAHALPVIPAEHAVAHDNVLVARVAQVQPVAAALLERAAGYGGGGHVEKAERHAPLALLVPERVRVVVAPHAQRAAGDREVPRV